MGHSKVETTKNIYGHLFAQDQADIVKAMNQAVTRLYVEEDVVDESGGRMASPVREVKEEVRSQI